MHTEGRIPDACDLAIVKGFAPCGRRAGGVSLQALKDTRWSLDDQAIDSIERATKRLPPPSRFVPQKREAERSAFKCSLYGLKETPDFVGHRLISTPSSTIVEADDGLLATLGYTRQELISRSIRFARFFAPSPLPIMTLPRCIPTDAYYRTGIGAGFSTVRKRTRQPSTQR